MKVAFRVDSSMEIGTGHVVRCLTLANRLVQAGAECRFVMRRLPGNMIGYVRAQGHAVVELPEPDGPFKVDSTGEHSAWLGVDWARDAKETEQAIRSASPLDWLVVDHYSLDSRWETCFRPYVRHLLVIDDLADRLHDCDVLLDQNAVVDADGRYDDLVPATSKKLLGPRFALLRPEFENRRARKPLDVAPAVQRVLVYFGGVDKPNLTLKVLQCLAVVANGRLRVDAVAGASNPHVGGLTDWCAGKGWINLHKLDADMASLMAQADVAIGAGGTTVWERACLGLPSMVVSLAANQEPGSAYLASQGAIIYAGRHDTADNLLEPQLRTLLSNPWLRESLAANSAALVDGAGAARVACVMLQPAVSLRRAVAKDSEKLLAWRNAPQVRANSLSSDPISPVQHARWLSATLQDPARDLLVGEVEGEPIGVLRFDHMGATAKASIYLVPGMSGRGFGSALLNAGTAWLEARRPECQVVEAEILTGNTASHRAFVGAGYSQFAQLYRLGLRK